MWRSLVLFTVLALFLSCQIGAETDCCIPIRLDVNTKSVSKDRLALSIRLTNTGDQVLRFSNGFGPWAGARQITLVAIKLPGGEPIPNQLRAMVDPALGMVEIQPGKAVQYDVPIDELYHELAAELRKGKSDIVLFWTYQLETWDSKKSERVGGWLMIQRPRLGDA